ncbi:hypothetical protein B0J17DRAFT_662375 [Rhizoctonia solani]|nr:hypothetical protein B0J17DRAFT_662375 [Rhizoctonia solani]
MLSTRIFLMRPALYAPISPQIRAFGLARIALEPARKTAPPPPPPPPPAKGRKTPAATKPTATIKATATVAAKKGPTTATKRATPVPVAAASTTTTRSSRLTERERTAKEKEKEKEKLAKAKEREREREKVMKVKEREKERERERKAKEREKEREKKEKLKLREAAKKEKEKAKVAASKMLEKPYPPPPRAPGTAYVLFASDRSVNRDRGEGVTEDASKAGQAWKALSETEREVYRKKYEKARAQWKEDMAKWISSLNLAQLTAARANRERGTRDDSTLDILPKRPSNAYALFLADITNRQDFRQKIDDIVQKEGLKDNRDVVRRRISLYGRTAADVWKTMSDKEKAVYTNKAAEVRKDWEKDYGHLIAAQKEEIAASLP